MKKFVALLLAAVMCLSVVPVLAGAEYTGSAKGFGSDVKVTFAVEDGKIIALDVDDSGETYTLAGIQRENSVDKVIAAILEAGTAEGVDVNSTATFTSTAIVEAINAALAAGEGEAAPLAFTAGSYEATATGYNGPSTFKVTFSDDKLEAIEVVSSTETGHVGDIAFDIMIPEMIEANGSGVDGVSGATFSSRALRNAVNDAAEQAACTNLAAFKANTVIHVAGEPIEDTYDVVIVGAGGAGIAAAAEAAQKGYTVLVIEKNAEVGGNTLVSGGQYQSVMPYLVWDAADPDATTGVYAFNGQTYDKVKSVQGCINELKMILDWNEEPFDEEYYKTNEFVAGDAKELSKHGVHTEYLPVLQELKKEIQAYLDWAQPQLDAGVAENQLTLFSTLNLHIFQTYYGGLRQSADKSQWIYGDLDLVKQFVEGGQGLKEWLEAQGATFREDSQPTLIGALWYRENEFIGSTIDLDGDGNNEMGRWGAYFAAPMTTLLNANEKNKIMLRTDAKELIVDETGRVTGVKAEKFDGTPVTVYANKGVVLATGGYAANIPLVLEGNVYWSSEYLTSSTKTTNRSSLQGDGIAMAEAVGAASTGMGFTQLMPISWVDNGNLAFGGGNYAAWINPNTGHRFVDEGSERDVLSLAEFRNGMTVNGTPGVFLEFYNATEPIPGPIQLPAADSENPDMAGRYYRRTIDQLPELFADLGVQADPAVVIETIKAYDMAVMGQGEYPDVGKAIASRCIGNVEKDENGNYLPDTYDLEGTLLTIRLMAPSTHHTMGGLVVDTQRHVLTADGAIIPGLYAAGEVTGGIHGGNRLGGNAIVEIFVSGRTAAQAIAEDDK
ncbi:MAG: FAD-dependent oxidoreductase [Clostridia bacterium]|nr:FAD-dependent oxidoreductase [Clostridia bacterium]